MSSEHNDWRTRKRDWAVVIAILVLAASVSLVTGDAGWIIVISATYVAVFAFSFVRYRFGRRRSS